MKPWFDSPPPESGVPTSRCDESLSPDYCSPEQFIDYCTTNDIYGNKRAEYADTRTGACHDFCLKSTTGCEYAAFCGTVSNSIIKKCLPPDCASCNSEQSCLSYCTTDEISLRCRARDLSDSVCKSVCTNLLFDCSVADKHGESDSRAVFCTILFDCPLP